MAELEDKMTFGSFNFHLTNELVRRGVISGDTTIKNRKTGETHHMNERDNKNSTIDSIPPVPSSAADSDRDEAETENRITNESETTDADDYYENDQVSERLKSMQKSASEARVQLTETRKALTKQRAINTAMQDNINKLQEDLRVADTEKENVSSQLIEQQDRLSEAISEVENTNARLQQLQEHYERLQIESQNQFEELDQFRAESMEREEEYRKTVNTEVEKSFEKTAIMIQILRLIKQDKDLKNEKIPEKLLAAPVPEKNKELQLKIDQLLEQIENERHHVHQVDEFPNKPAVKNPHRNIIIILLAAILFGIIVLLSAVLWQGHTTEAAAKPPVSPINSTYEHNIVVPKISDSKSDITDTDNSNVAPIASASPTGNLDLPPENNSSTLQENIIPVNWPDIVLPRSKITHNNKALRIVFSYGIFSKSTEISPNAKIDLTNLAKQLKHSINNFTLIVEGHTDTTPISSSDHVNNYALGTERAVTVKDFLEKECEIPHGIIRTASAGESDPPYPNDTNESRRKNRTVVMTLIPRQNS